MKMCRTIYALYIYVDIKTRRDTCQKKVVAFKITQKNDNISLQRLIFQRKNLHKRDIEHSNTQNYRNVCVGRRKRINFSETNTRHPTIISLDPNRPKNQYVNFFPDNRKINLV